MDTFPPALQRPALQALASAMDARASSLRRDECGDWRISGHLGHIYADQDGSFVLCVTSETARMWGSVKAKLQPLAILIRDGDTDGVFRLDRLPTPFAGTGMRKALRIPKRIEHTDAFLAQLRSRMASMRSPGELAIS